VRVLAATGLAGFSQTSERCFCRPFLSPVKAGQAADVAVCTGGIGVCYQNLTSGLPSLVVPFQPEQATNGLHFQQQGCARTFAPEVAFTGHTRQYAEAIDYDRVAATLRDMIEQRANFAAPIERMQRRLATCDALKSIGDFVLSRI
jgi:UDP:flavonoid glycosyltransferase YjiC (YdhE family)